MGADNELRDELKKMDHARITEQLLEKRIQWHFNPADSPHMGGAWERLVKTVKRALNPIIKDTIPTEYQLLTFMTEVEAIVNSRPITSVSDSIDDFEALTPNHFLIGRASPFLPVGLSLESDKCSRKRWKQVQLMKNHFWKRFENEYLHTITTRGKWRKEKRNVKEGDLVLICDRNTSRKKWLMGRVLECYRGNDGLVRSVKVKTSTNELTRAVTRLCPLELNVEK